MAATDALRWAVLVLGLGLGSRGDEREDRGASTSTKV